MQQRSRSQGQTWTLLNTFAGDGRTAPMNTFPSFAETAAPPGQEPAQLWLRVSYDELKDAMPVSFHEVSSMRGPAGRVYKLRNHFPAGSADPKDTGWLTYTDSSSGQVRPATTAPDSLSPC